jgi:CRP/FNR family transcriptional regulator
MEDCLGALFITRGQIRTYITSDEGREITLFRLHAGDTSVLSASCVFSELAFDVSISACEDVEAVLLSSNCLDQLKKQNVYVDLFFSKLMNEQFSDIMWALQQILFFGIDKRVAIFLWDEAAASGDMTLHYTQEEVATAIGSAREVVSRVLKIFAEDGIVRLGRGKITILDKSRLRKLCD